jgi:hypothetical protein
LEQSRALLEKQGVHLAAISYDAVETLLGFAHKYNVGFPLLSDRESAVIRSFGIFNRNIAAGLRAHGVPHPVEYLVAPDGVIVRKYFVPNYQHRVTGAAVVLREFGAAGDASVVTMKSGAVTVKIGLASARAFAGQELGYFARFALEPGWHVDPSASIVFNDPNVLTQTFSFPQGSGSMLLRWPIDAGPLRLSGEVRFQACSETVCEPPETVPFELTINLQPFMVAV